MLRVAIVGCGKIADQHLLAIRRLPDCAVVALCDHERLMAQQLAERFGVADTFSNVREMLTTVRPDVVHVTTPPLSHLDLAGQCMEVGSHVYLEKPFTVTADEAQCVVQMAQRRGLQVTAGHNYQFTLEMLEMRRLVREGYLGGDPVHLECHWTYDLGDTSYVGPILSSPRHWVRQLPGQLLQNVISHGIARLAEFLGDDIDVHAMGHQSAQLRGLGGEEVIDELRVLLRDRSRVTASFCFSTQLKPGVNQFRICGPAHSLVVDQVSGSLIRHVSKSDKSYLTYVRPPIRLAAQHVQNAVRNVRRFARQELYQDGGLKELIGRFYDSIRTGGAPPIPYREILLTARIMDTVFEQVYERRTALVASAEPQRR